MTNFPRRAFDGRDHLAIEETHLGADPDLTHRRRDFGKAGRLQAYGAVTRVHLAGAEFPVPEISRLGLEADPGMIGRAAALVRTVADAGLLLMRTRSAPWSPGRRGHVAEAWGAATVSSAGARALDATWPIRELPIDAGTAVA
jgi:hypothetical protein